MTKVDDAGKVQQQQKTEQQKDPFEELEKSDKLERGAGKTAEGVFDDNIQPAMHGGCAW